MAVCAVSITKSCPFRDSVQEFTNVYHYNFGTVPDEAGALTIINTQATREKAFHSTNATFIRGRLWTAGGTKAQNNMIAQTTLSGTGALGVTAGTDRERAYLIFWDAGFDSRGHAVKLRKWYHVWGGVGGVTLSSTILDNTTGFTVANRTAIANVFDVVTTAGPGADRLCAESGRPSTGAAQCHKYYEHHQLGDMWRNL